MSAVRLVELPRRRAAEPVSEDAPHAACILEQARRAEYLRRVIADHADEIAEWERNYNELVNRCLTAESKVRAFEAIFASVSSYPALQGLRLGGA